MPERNVQKERLQIYKEKLSELCRQKEDLESENQALQAENKVLQADNQNLTAKYKALTEGKKTPGSSLPAFTEQAGGEPLTLPAPKQVKFRLLFPLTALLALAALIAAAGFYIRMDRFEKSYYQELNRSRQMEKTLSETQDTLTQTQNTMTETEKALAETRDALAEGQDDLAQTQEALAQTKESLTETKEALKESKNQLAQANNRLEKGYGYASSKLYADEGVVILDVGQKKSVEVYNPSYYMFATASDKESVSITQSNSHTVRPKVHITAKQPGICLITCAAYSRSTQAQAYFKESFDILVVVKEP